MNQLIKSDQDGSVDQVGPVGPVELVGPILEAEAMESEGGTLPPPPQLTGTSPSTCMVAETATWSEGSSNRLRDAAHGLNEARAYAKYEEGLLIAEMERASHHFRLMTLRMQGMRGALAQASNEDSHNPHSLLDEAEVAVRDACAAMADYKVIHM